jgi:hypothetical protein
VKFGLKNASCDCEVTWGIITGTIYFNKEGTAQVAVGGTFAGVVIGAACAIAALTVAGVGFCAVIVVYEGLLVADAGSGVAEHRCLEIGYTFLPPYWNGAGLYTGGYCTGSY